MILIYAAATAPPLAAAVYALGLDRVAANWITTKITEGTPETRS